MKKHYYLDRIVEVCDHKHLTVDEIFTALKEEFPEVGKSSVYRNVEELSKKGELVKIK
jgi:Fur family peroxide stress response transcriptional regulator